MNVNVPENFAHETFLKLQMEAFPPIPPPTAMVAQPGEFAKNTKHSVTQTDVDNDGNFVITTSTVRIVKVGTPEYISMVKLAFQKKNKAEAV